MIQDNLCEAIKDNTIITGGHFTLTDDGGSINLGTIDSFRKSVELYASEKSHFSNLGLGVLINDIGEICSSSACSVGKISSRDKFILPESYKAILAEFGIEEKELLIFWEKHIRNRAKKLLRAEVNKNNPYIIYQEKEGYFYRCPDENIELILTRYSKKDEKGTPACPLIMGAYAFEQKRLGFDSSLNFYYVGEDNYMNVANHFVIEKGRFLAARFDKNIGDGVKNVYVFKDKIMKDF